MRAGAAAAHTRSMATAPTIETQTELLTEIAVHMDWLESFDVAHASPDELARHVDERRKVLARLATLHGVVSGGLAPAA